MSEIITKPLLEAFDIDDTKEVKPFSGGHINDTFIATRQGKHVMLQRINQFVFPNPQDIMENMVSVTDFLRKKITENGGDPERECMTLIKTTGGSYSFIDENGEFWRCSLFIENTTAYENISGTEILTEAGYAFGNFQRLLGDYPADTLHEIIVDFHNTPERFNQLDHAAKENKANRLDEVTAELEFANANRKSCSLLMELLNSGDLPLRVTHNDTKMSNVLIDDNTGKAICVIDLDTVMPGLTAFDFGDSIRAAATTAAEDEADLSKVNFSLEHFEAYAKGFLSAAGNTLTQKELETLPDGAITMTLEVGIRFLADYLNGDVYFRTAYDNHNLVRARNQFKLVDDMEKARVQMSSIIAKYTK